MCHSYFYHGSGVSEPKFISLSQPETPVHYCLTCGHELEPGTHHKQPNQFSRSRWKRVFVCTKCGKIHTPDIWENSAKEEK